MLKFTINCKPSRSTNQSNKRVGVRKNGSPFSYTTPKGKKLESEFASLLMPYAPEKPLEGCLKLEVVYALPLLKSEKKEVRERGWAYHWKKPDGDNLVKMFQDTMGRLLFWNDDAQVVILKFIKIRSLAPGITVRLGNVSEETKFNTY